MFSNFGQSEKNEPGRLNFWECFGPLHFPLKDITWSTQLLYTIGTQVNTTSKKATRYKYSHAVFTLLPGLARAFWEGGGGGGNSFQEKATYERNI